MAEQRQNQHLVMKLLAWYDTHARILPWRARGAEQPDAFKVWLSEIMLQQTTVAAVKTYFLKFVSTWPTVEALAAAPLDDVLRAWAGLGYYARARNLHACAKVVAERHGGIFPSDVEGLVTLPGIGPYTAAAIAAIAFGRPHAAVDGNVERVLSRLDAIDVPLPASKPLIRARADALMTTHRPGDFVQALMDLGATICTPKSPRCPMCPWSDECQGRRRGIAETLPRKRARKTVPTRQGHAYVAVRADGAVLLRRRAAKGLLGGMMEVPGSAWGNSLPAFAPPVAGAWKKRAGAVQHVFTHFRLEVTVWVARDVVGAAPDDSYRWVDANAMLSEALPTVMRKVLARGLSGG